MPIFTLDPGALPAGYAEALLPLADAKAHLRVEGDEDDTLIGYYRDAAIELVEKMAEMAFGPRDGVVAQDVRIGSDGAVCVGLWPIRAVTSVQGYDGAGDPVIVTPGDLVIRRDRLIPGPGKSWPSGVGEIVDIVFDAGAETAELAQQRYAGLLQAVRLMLAYLFTNREGGGPDGDIPPGVVAIVNRYRIMRL